MILAVLTTHVFEGPAKGSEKKGTTKEPRHKVFSGLPELRGQTKKLPLCLRVFVVQGFYAFCDSLVRGGDA